MGAALAALLGLTLLSLPASAASADTAPGGSTPAAKTPGESGPAQSSPAQSGPAESAPAEAAPTASPTGTPTPPATAPTIDDPGDALVTQLPLRVTGTGDPGDRLQISGGAGAASGSRCTVSVGRNGRWVCSIDALPDGPSVVIRAASSASGLSTTARVAVLSPPVIEAPSGGFVTGGGIHGSAYPGADVTVRASNGTTCRFPADSNGAWACVLGGLASGHYTVTATQRAPFSDQSSAAGPSVPITVDVTPPARPAITSPRPDATASTGQAVTFAGRGESGAHVTVYGSDDAGSTVVCTATVASGIWRCRGTLPSGSFLISALQRDAAGNVSPGSNTVPLRFVAPATTPSRTPEPTPTDPPSSAAPPAPPRTTPTPAPSPYTGRSEPGMPDWLRTPFTNASAPVVTAASFPGWLRSVLLAVAALILLALPARLLAGTLARNRSEPREPRPSALFGRNRSRADLRESEARLGASEGTDALAGSAAPALPQHSRWSVPAAFAAAAALVTLSSPVDDTAAYVRVVLAVALALIALNGLWIGLARWTAPHLTGGPARIAFRPYQLLIVGATAILSRLFGLQPALLFGLILGVVLVEGAGRLARGRIAAVQLTGLAAAGVLAWLAVGMLPHPTGAVSAFLLELVNAFSLLALGSAAVALIPVGALAGRALFQWSRLLWLGLSLVVYTLLFALLLPVASLVQTGASWLLVTLTALAFAALSLCVWLWERFVEPAQH